MRVKVVIEDQQGLCLLEWQTQIDGIVTECDSAVPPSSLAEELLSRLKQSIDSMSSSIPEATEDDVLAPFAIACPPEDLAPENAWEELDPILNRLVGYGMSPQAFAGTVRRGERGMKGVWRFLEAWVSRYRIEGKLLEGKVATMIAAIELV